MTNGSLMKVESIAECSLWSILLYFWPALSDYQSWKLFFGLFESSRFTRVLLYPIFRQWEWQFYTSFAIYFSINHRYKKAILFADVSLSQSRQFFWTCVSFCMVWVSVWVNYPQDSWWVLKVRFPYWQQILLLYWFCCHLLTFFKINFQMVWIQIVTDILFNLIWIQAVCKGH